MIDTLVEKPLFQSKFEKIDIIRCRIFGFAPNHNVENLPFYWQN